MVFMLDTINQKMPTLPAADTECANQVFLNNSCLREMTKAVHTFNFSRAIRKLCML